MVNKKRVYLFGEGNATMRDLLGGKGANLAEMTNIGLPVPPGFIITTEVCNEYYAVGGTLPDGLMDEVRTALAEIEREMGRKLGDRNNPLLVSVRSGAKFSMPGMMDTVLNLGLNDASIQGLIEGTGNERFAYDAYRRFIMMFSDIVLGVAKSKFEALFDSMKEELGVRLDTDVGAANLKKLVASFKELSEKETGRSFPSDPMEQLTLAIEAVFRSWNNERAITYRNREKIPHDLGTAISVQTMVFGNMGADSGTGVAFTRDVATGEKKIYGEFLMNAQGEDVVAGVRTPEPIEKLQDINPAIYQQFLDIAKRLEDHYRDVQDIEFTIERGKLYILQCRAGKRTAAAAVKIAVDMAYERLISREEALLRVKPNDLDQLLHRQIDPKAEFEVLTRGLAASPGAAVGAVVFDADTAAARGNSGEKVILVRPETNPDDIHGLLAAQGVLTARGGMTSHAAVVARGFGIPCVAGAETIRVEEERRRFSVDGKVVKEGDTITIDGSTGRVIVGEVPMIEPQISGEFKELLDWADATRRLGVRTNADNPEDAANAFNFGAEGIGLCRTEHMFFARERLPIVQRMILAENEEEREAALDQLLPFQREDFIGIFKAMQGRPVTIRLIDPPLHEFLPSHDELLEEVTTLAARLKYGCWDNPDDPEYRTLREALADKEKMLAKVNQMREMNPMLGLRGVRLSIVFPGIVKMQVTAIMEAAAQVKKSGMDCKPEIMIPLVAHVNELKVIRDQLERVVKDVLAKSGIQVDYKFGTMIEIPRAALTAEEIAKYAEFFSFGTNDLTQTTFGFSRDDAEGKFLGRYLELGLLKDNPFETLDRTGVGRLMNIAVADAQKVNPGIKLGICGEHGGDPSSIAFCHEIGLDYVSCFPFRVPIARLAAAQANIKIEVTVDK
jgi:pyruvate,orthophosphate dikinase